MGEVYLAHDTSLGRSVALKLLPAHFAGDAERLRRFEQEAWAASALNHPNIVTVYEVGRAGAANFIASEFIEGEPLSATLARGLGVDGRTDVWSLGVVLFEAVARRTPFEGETTNDVIAAILTAEPPRLSECAPGVPAELERIAAKALRKDREERYQTAKDFGLDLKSLGRRMEFEAEPGRPATRDEGDAETGRAPHARVGETGRRRRGAAFVLAALALASAVVAAWLFWPWKNTSVAVLPFGNEGGGPETEYLSEGISEGIIDSLSQLPQLKVIAATSSFKYRDRGEGFDTQEAARALGVRTIVTGKVARLGDSLRISVAVGYARDGTQVWGAQYNRRASDLQAVQEEIARTISERLRVRLTGAQERQLAKRMTDNPEADQLYLNGEFYVRKTGLENDRKALDCYNKAIALDPKFAEAYVGLAEVFDHFAGSPGFDLKHTLDKAKAAAAKALELDETQAKAHAWLGSIKIDEWDWPGAEAEFKRAIGLNPGLQSAHALYSPYLSIMGRHASAPAEAGLAEDLDPLQVRPKFVEGMALFLARRYDEAIRQMRNVLELQHDFALAHLITGDSYTMKGMYAEAVAEYVEEEKGQGVTPEVRAHLGYAYAASGRRDEALAILDELKTSKERVSSAESAVLYAGLGDKEEAIGAHELELGYINVDPHYDSLRSDPRFADVVRRVGLAP